jgi:hypothetical protein
MVIGRLVLWARYVGASRTSITNHRQVALGSPQPLTLSMLCDRVRSTNRHCLPCRSWIDDIREAVLSSDGVRSLVNRDSSFYARVSSALLDCPLLLLLERCGTDSTEDQEKKYDASSTSWPFGPLSGPMYRQRTLPTGHWLSRTTKLSHSRHP